MAWHNGFDDIMTKLGRVLREEVEGFHWQYMLAWLLLKPFPLHTGRRTRPFVMRTLGFRIGKGTMMLGTPILSGHGNWLELLTIGRSCWVNTGITFDLGASVTIGDNVSMGQNIIFITNSHYIGGERRAEGLTTA